MIEQLLAELNQRLAENTQALRDVLAASAGTTPVAAEAPKPAKAKKGKAAAVEPEPAVETVTEPVAPEEPVVEETPEPEPAVVETPDWGSATYLLKITEFVKGKLVADGGAGKVKAEYEKIRDQFGVKKATELSDDQLGPFWSAIQSL
jgi:hypothetical protein